MTTNPKIRDFVAKKQIALVGYSRRPGAFSRMALKELRKRGYTVYPINPHSNQVDGETCYPDFQSLPEPVDAALFITSADTIRNTYPEAVKSGVKFLWIQQGIKDLSLLQELDSVPEISVVHSRCILMYAEPVLGFHKIHRWVDQWFT